MPALSPPRACPSSTCGRRRELGTAALSPQHVGPIPDQQLRQTDKRLLETETFVPLLFFLTFSVTN